MSPSPATNFADVEAGKVDVIVVYKVDRLSRSLLDFAKMMERFNAAGASFVSVTQNFSTADAMGRLTLNMLMSFAEFEREMIAERTRDKIAGARRKGKWTGGSVPLGYTVVDKRLSYRFKCDDARCNNGHKMMIEDWEIAQLYLQMRDKFGDAKAAAEKVRQKFFDQMCAADVDTHFFVGTVAKYGTWIVLGVFWLKK